MESLAIIIGVALAIVMADVGLQAVPIAKATAVSR